MTKISQLVDIGASLAANDELLIRDVSDGSTPNKKVTASGFFNVATALGFTGLDTIVAGVANEAKVQVFASGISGRTDTTLSGVVVARTTISGYYENASGVVGGVLFPVVTQTDIGTAPNQVPVNGMLGSMAFQDANFPSLGSAAITQISNVPLLSGGGIKFPPTQVASSDANTLDDYEEGTWTVSFFDAVSGGNVSATTGTGYYTKIGDTVRAAFFVLNINTSGMTAGNNMHYTLPFTHGSGVETGSAFVGTTTIAGGVAAYLGANSSRALLVEYSSGNPYALLTVSDFTSGSADIAVTITYSVG
jgi:hypothetical protein